MKLKSPFGKNILIRFFRGSYAIDYMHLDPKHFPTTTQSVFSPEFIVRMGVLPLGIKRERRFLRPHECLNVGVLDPTETGLVPKLKEEMKHPFQKIRVYLVLPEEFLDILEQCYHLTLTHLRGFGSKGVNPSLWQIVNQIQ